MRLDESDEVATIRLWFEFGEPAPSDQALALVRRRCTASSVSASAPTGAPWQPASHARPLTSRRTTGSSAPGLQFEHDFTGLVFYPATSTRPTRCRTPDAAVCAAVPRLGRLAAGDDLGAGQGPRGVPAPARQVLDGPDRPTLGVDRRTLHRHLADEGESFSSILHSTRVGLAEHYLANDRYSMTDVSSCSGSRRRAPSPGGSTSSSG